MIKQDVTEQQKELIQTFGDQPDSIKDQLSRAVLAEQSYLRTIDYWRDKIREAEYHIDKNTKKIHALYENINHTYTKK